MKPVVIIQFLAIEGPGYLATFLDEQQIPWQLIRIDEGESLPVSLEMVGGMVLMGGAMSVNDDLPWIPPLLNLIQSAIKADIPVLGHCLGGQLMTKAFGGVVTKCQAKEIGWAVLTVSKNEVSRHWFGDIESFNGFHWHGETFSLPPNATHLLASASCHNQAYALGKHLALQCHIEMTPEMVKTWCSAGADELQEASAGPAVQQADDMQQNLLLHCFFLQKVASQVYTQWIKGLVN